MGYDNKKDIDINKILHNKLKGISIDAIEAGISKAVSELVGEDYKCSINNIKFSMFSGAELNLKVELSLKSDEDQI
ncbi:MAG: hypothetical protein WCJ01_07385 [Ignavibacteria bacterium]